MYRLRGFVTACAGDGETPAKLSNVKPYLLPSATACVAVFLSACGERQLPPEQPPPLVAMQSPATGVLGGAPSRYVPGGGRALAHCGSQLPVQELLQRINRVRATGYRCGGRTLGAAAPVRWDASLYSAAAGHSLDMAKRNYFEHHSPEGRDVASRVTAVRYHWRAVGENIAAGNLGPAEAMQAWLESPGHCENIMNPDYADVAVACVADSHSQWGTYWTMVLGRKR
jgi:uncharacterized protein YkwD